MGSETTNPFTLSEYVDRIKWAGEGAGQAAKDQDVARAKHFRGDFDKVRGLLSPEDRAEADVFYSTAYTSKARRPQHLLAEGGVVNEWDSAPDAFDAITEKDLEQIWSHAFVYADSRVSTDDATRYANWYQKKYAILGENWVDLPAHSSNYLRSELAADTGIELAEGGIVGNETTVTIAEVAPEAVVPLDEYNEQIEGVVVAEAAVEIAEAEADASVAIAEAQADAAVAIASIEAQADMAAAVVEGEAIEAVAEVAPEVAEVVAEAEVAEAVAENAEDIPPEVVHGYFRKWSK